jgi:CheY-like chemotaxis protein
MADDDDAAELPAAPPRLAGKCVVVIDNDAMVLDGIRLVLDGWGCRLVGAASGEEAVARLAAAAVIPDLVVADYHLDDGALGTGAIRALRARYGSRLPALVISGDRSPEVRASTKAAGYSFLAKPTRPARLRAMISYLVSPPGAG